MSADKPLHIFADTNFLIEQGFSSGVMASLGDIRKAGLAFVYVSRVTIDEYKNKLKDYRLSVEKVEKEISGKLPNNFAQITLHEVADCIEKTRTGIDEKIKQCFDVVELSELDFREAYKGYMNGDPPYNVIRCKEMIPDAWIYHSVKSKLASLEGETIHFLGKDGNLKKSIALIDGVKCWESARDFIESDFLKTKISSLEIQKLWLASIEEVGGIAFLLTEQLVSMFEKMTPSLASSTVTSVLGKLPSAIPGAEVLISASSYEASILEFVGCPKLVDIHDEGLAHFAGTIEVEVYAHVKQVGEASKDEERYVPELYMCNCMLKRPFYGEYDLERREVSLLALPSQGELIVPFKESVFS